MSATTSYVRRNMSDEMCNDFLRVFDDEIYDELPTCVRRRNMRRRNVSDEMCDDFLRAFEDELCDDFLRAFEDELCDDFLRAFDEICDECTRRSPSCGRRNVSDEIYDDLPTCVR